MLPEYLYRAATVREFDRLASEQYGVPSATLMQRAGEATFRLLCLRWPRARAIAIVCGPGNNGGDGYVLARLACDAGLFPWVLTLGEPDAVKGDAALMRDAARASGVMDEPFVADMLADSDVIVDALLGTGLERPVTGVWREAIEAINGSGRPVLAIDIPSGLSADTGAVLGAAVRADTTLTFVALKAGLFTARGREHAGEIYFDDLSVPAEVHAEVAPAAQRITRTSLRDLLRRRARDAHKGSFGRVLAIGGAPGMPGAVRLCGEAAYRCGAGMVTLATHPGHAAVVNAARPELMAYPVASVAALKPLLARATVVALGPGLGRGAWGKRLFSAALAAKRPLVIDADGLFFFLAPSRRHRSDWVLTPHAGEAARLLGCSVEEIERDRFAAVRAISDKYGGVCVLKGAGTLVAAHGDPRVYLCDGGNPGMASGGMGDVLTGVIAALRAQGLSPVDAARLGVWVHASAGDLAATSGGEIGVLASDLLVRLREVLNGVVT